SARLEPDQPGLAPFRIDLLPLVEPRGGDEAAARGEGLAEGRLGGGGLGAGVDEAALLAERVVRHEAPLALDQHPTRRARLDQHDRHRLRRGDVVAGREFGRLVEPESLRDLLAGGGLVEAAAHRLKASGRQWLPSFLASAIAGRIPFFTRIALTAACCFDGSMRMCPMYWPCSSSWARRAGVRRSLRRGRTAPFSARASASSAGPRRASARTTAVRDLLIVWTSAPRDR